MKARSTLFVILLVLTSCVRQYDKVPRERIIGRYVWNEDQAGALDVNDDGTYRYWMYEDTAKLENFGTWELDSVSNAVAFDNFSFLTDDLPRGVWVSELRSQNNEVQLMYADDSNTYLKKVE